MAYDLSPVVLVDVDNVTERGDDVDVDAAE